MKLVKSLALGSVAVLTVSAGAQAADLPSRKAAPVEYVRVCDVYGAGFFYIPGTNTCLRVGGRIRFGFEYSPAREVIDPATGDVSQVKGNQDTTGINARGRVDLDARTQTDYGTVQAVARLRLYRRDGLRADSGPHNFGLAYTPNGESDGFTLERAFIRFAGITAGVGPDNFGGPRGGLFYSGTLFASFPTGVKELAYTAVFGGGLSATLAVESRQDFPYGKGTSGVSVPPSKVPTGSKGWWQDQWDTGYLLVGNVRFDQSWGHIEIGGLVTSDSVGQRNGYPLEPSNSSSYALWGAKTYGAYGVQGTINFKLPMIAHGDQADLHVAYGHGFLGAVLPSGGLSNLSTATNRRFLGGVTRVDSNLVPTRVYSDGHVASYGLTDAWGVFGEFTHYWTPHWRSNFSAGYADVTPPSANCTDTYGFVNPANSPYCWGSGGLNTQWGEGQLFEANGNLIWSPTKHFDIGVDVEYLHLKSKMQNPTQDFILAGEPGLTEDGFVYHLRLQRDF